MDCLKEINGWMANNFLQLNTDKIDSLILAPESIKPQIRQCLGPFSSTVKPLNLGLIFYQSFDAHIKSLTTSLLSSLKKHH